MIKNTDDIYDADLQTNRGSMNAVPHIQLNRFIPIFNMCGFIRIDMVGVLYRLSRKWFLTADRYFKIIFRWFSFTVTFATIRGYFGKWKGVNFWTDVLGIRGEIGGERGAVQVLRGHNFGPFDPPPPQFLRWPWVNIFRN